MANTPLPSSAKPPRRHTKAPLVWIVLICLAPVILALLAYYVPSLGLRPDGTSAYGTLVTPQRPLPPKGALNLTTLEGEPFDLHSLDGKWILVTIDQGACPESCVKKLFTLRNSHASQGKNVLRLARVWIITDNAPVPDAVFDAYHGTTIVRADPRQVAAYFAPQATAANLTQALRDPMWIIDPFGHLMMKFPADADPIEVRDDIRKLLRNSRIG